MREILAQAEAKDVDVVLPTDGVVAKEFHAGAAARVVDVGSSSPTT